MEKQCKTSKLGEEKPPPKLKTSESQKVEKSWEGSIAKASQVEELYVNRLQSTRGQSQEWHSYVG
jgi:hypothetical protein